ncbi:MAG TPA: type II secretion system minor pseudopilin GspK [Gammaproteobacteria bacterium]|nr:type II secretion system minor pseudopilin GspK [Gammaproteobacteria bacterium]
MSTLHLQPITSCLRHAQRGVALLTALLVTAIIAIIAVNMASTQQLDIRRTGNIFDVDQAYLYTLGIESWAQNLLAKDFLKNPAVDNLSEDWASALAPIKVEGGKVAAEILDMQGRFNLNNLVGQDDKPSDEDVRIFQRLLIGLKLEPELVQPLIDWIDKNVELTIPNGAEDVEYLKHAPPYRTANAPLTSPSELLLIKGFTPEVYARIAPFIATLPTLPQPTKINVNTAPAQVLASLADNMSLADGEALVKARKTKAFATLEEFKLHPALAGREIKTDKLAVSTSYFLVAASSQAGRAQVQLYSLLYRDPEDKVRVIMRGQGAF